MKNESLHISLSDAEGKFFKQKHSIIRVLGGCFFSAADKNLDSEAQATANRKKSIFPCTTKYQAKLPIYTTYQNHYFEYISFIP